MQFIDKATDNSYHDFLWFFLSPDHIWVILPDTLMVLGAEVLVDWIKHAFITKFNEISAEVCTGAKCK